MLGPDAVVRGWAVDRSDASRRLEVRLWIDGQDAGSTVADRLRPDLSEGDGRYGFVIGVPQRWLDGADHDYAVTVDGDGTRLKQRQPNLRFDASNRPKLRLLEVHEHAIVGEALGEHVLKADGLWLVWADGRGLPLELPTAWEKGEPGRHPFRIELHNLDLAQMLSADVGLCYPGDLEPEGVARLWSASTLDWRVEGSTVRLRLGDGVRPPDGLELELLVQRGRRPPTRLRAAIRNQEIAFELEPQQLSSSCRMALVVPVGAGGRELGELVYRANQAPCLANADFSAWVDGRPAGWILGDEVVPDRGVSLQGKDPGQPDQANTVVLRFTAAAVGRTLLSQDLACEPEGYDCLELAARLRGSPGAVVALRLLDATGAVAHTGEAPLSAAWKVARQALRLEEFTPAVARFELALVRAPALGTGDLWLELDAVQVPAAPEDAPPDLLAAPGRQPPLERLNNLVVNSGLTRWPGGQLPRPTSGRFEAACGWFVMNAGGKAAVSVAPFPLSMVVPDADAGVYGLNIRADTVERYCRIELELHQAPAPGVRMALRIALGQAAAVLRRGAGGRSSRPLMIDRIFLLRRRERQEAQADVVQDLARRLLTPTEREELAIVFTVGAPPAPEEDGQGWTYFVALEFSAPFDITLDSVSLAADETLAPELRSDDLCFEDRNIVRQLNHLKGADDWRSDVLIGPQAQRRPGATGSEDVLRWSWAHAALGSVEVVVCVHNALETTLECLQSLVGSAVIPHTVRIVDDGSDRACAVALDAFVADKPWFDIIRNPTNLGYTRSADRGIRDSRADWVILLNSDTVVSPGWMKGLVECALSDPSIAMVGPLSNAATYQSVPDIYGAGGKWAINRLPPGWSVRDMAAEVARRSERRFPRVPLLNGFCTLIRRSVYLEIGGFDLSVFPSGYGEENDLCVRVAAAGYALAVADHVYVYHHKSASFGAARQRQLSAQGDAKLRSKHPDVDIGALGRSFIETPALTDLRASIREAYSSPRQARSQELEL